MHDIVTDIIKTCPVCVLAPTKTLFRQCGDKRSKIYRPLEALIVDSLYLPRDHLGHSKALIIADNCTSRICIFPGRDLTAATVRKHLLSYLYCHAPPKYIISDRGSEFSENLDTFLAEYDIQLLSPAAHQKGSSALAELSIRLA